MGGGCSRPIKHDESESLSLQEDEIYNEEAQDAVDFAMKKKVGLQTSIELTISCQNLPKLDFLSQTDSKVVCYVEEGGNFSRHGSTELILDCPDPCFITKIKVDYNFEKPQTLRFEIYDVDEFKEQDLLDKQELIGHVTTTLHQIVCSPEQTLCLDIIGNKTRKNRARKCGTLTVTGREIDDSSNKISFQIILAPFTARSDSKLDLVPFDYADFLRVFEFRPANKKGLEWNLTVIPLKTLAHDNSKLKFKILERFKNDKKVFFGEVDVNLSEILNNGGGKARVKKNGTDVGEMRMRELKRSTRYTFLNYVDSGAEISLIIAMDFTKSNNEPSDPKSLHYCMRDQDNEYLQALKSIGGILQYYDSDNKIPLYGFGAKLPPYFNTVSNCFSLNGNYFDPEVYGLEEVIKVYKDALTKYKFHGPTIFSELLRMAIEYTKAESAQGDTQKYFILLILTDGEIGDFDQTKEEIIKASELPMSIIIIGVGNENFEQMKALDGDDQGLTGPDGTICRDIVQFVPFSKHKNDPRELAKKTLEEVPKQFLEYMRAHDIEPVKSSRKTRFAEKVGIEGSGKVSTLTKPKIIPNFLVQEKERFVRELLELEIDQRLIERILEEGIPAPNISLVIEMISHQKEKLMNRIQNNSKVPSIEVDILRERIAAPSLLKTIKKNPKLKVRHFKSHLDQSNAFESLIPKEYAYGMTHMILNYKGEKAENKDEESQVESVRKDKSDLSLFAAFKTKKVFEHADDDASQHFKELTRNRTPLSVGENICLHCNNRVINTVLMPCGHAAFCEKCLTSNRAKSCKICNQRIGYFTIMRD